MSASPGPTVLLVAAALAASTALLLLCVSGPDYELLASLSGSLAAVAFVCASLALRRGGWRFRATVTVLLVATMAVLMLAPFPIPPHRLVAREQSPDRAMSATYSWRPAGVLGAITGDNPWVYLTITSGADGRPVAFHKAWADVPQDAVDRLSRHVPWHSKRDAAGEVWSSGEDPR